MKPTLCNQTNPDQLIEIFTTELGDRAVPAVSARAMFDFLNVGAPFEVWIGVTLDGYDWKEGRDYSRIEKQMNQAPEGRKSGIPPVVQVDNIDIPVIAYQDTRVISTELLAKVYGTDIKHIQNNFARNRDRFESGKHYFKLEGEELTIFKRVSPNLPKNTRNLVLWTERGAARHAKMLETDQAWDVFDKLEDAYFGEASKPIVYQDYSLTLTMAIGLCVANNTEKSRILRHFLMESERGMYEPVAPKADTQPAVNESNDDPAWVIAKRALSEYSQLLSKHNSEKYSELRTLIAERALHLVKEHYSRAWATMDDKAKDPLTHALYVNLLSYQDAIYWSITEAFPKGPTPEVWLSIVAYIKHWQPFNRITGQDGDEKNYH